ncbi:MAG: bifunctional phosphoribosylaminoimidazolecarboxamide formyltransferase/IMP cyclohydrolase, partial [Acidobacteriota bacterium]
MKIQRALISVFDKQGLTDLGRFLSERGVEILSSGGTARHLKEAGVPVVLVEEYTGSPEVMDGRVKTLHPKVHAGLLARRNRDEDIRDLERLGAQPIDLLIVNFYPFETVSARPDASREEVIEMIDIGGPSMVRAASKNHAFVGVVVHPSDYPALQEEITRTGGLEESTRRRLALRAFRETSRYDALVQAYLGREQGTEAHPDHLVSVFDKVQDLRYGENPHQSAAFYREPSAPEGTLASARVLQGKELSYNNLLDLDSAWRLALSFEDTCAAIIKHTNPCGAALGASPEEAFDRALECDPVSAFGGVVAFNREVGAGTADRLVASFYEAVIAPAFSDEAVARLRRKENLRVLHAPLPADGPRHPRGRDLRRVTGGLLVQDWDQPGFLPEEPRLASRREPTAEENQVMRFAWTVAAHVKSNAIVLARSDRTVGIGAGQMSRVDSVKLAAMKARSDTRGCALASDAFFPFRDGIDEAARAGVRCIIQPGGSRRDKEVIAACDEHGMAMVFTGRRHFRH